MNISQGDASWARIVQISTLFCVKNGRHMENAIVKDDNYFMLKSALNSIRKVDVISSTDANSCISRNSKSK